VAGQAHDRLVGPTNDEAIGHAAAVEPHRGGATQVGIDPGSRRVAFLPAHDQSSAIDDLTGGASRGAASGRPPEPPPESVGQPEGFRTTALSIGFVRCQPDERLPEPVASRSASRPCGRFVYWARRPEVRLQPRSGRAHLGATCFPRAAADLLPTSSAPPRPHESDCLKRETSNHEDPHPRDDTHHKHDRTDQEDPVHPFDPRQHRPRLLPRRAVGVPSRDAAVAALGSAGAAHPDRPEIAPLVGLAAVSKWPFSTGESTTVDGPINNRRAIACGQAPSPGQKPIPGRMSTAVAALPRNVVIPSASSAERSIE
jgi:hypothetical protein